MGEQDKNSYIHLQGVSHPLHKKLEDIAKHISENEVNEAYQLYKEHADNLNVAMTTPVVNAIFINNMETIAERCSLKAANPINKDSALAWEFLQHKIIESIESAYEQTNDDTSEKTHSTELSRGQYYTEGSLRSKLRIIGTYISQNRVSDAYCLHEQYADAFKMALQTPSLKVSFTKNLQEIAERCAEKEESSANQETKDKWKRLYCSLLSPLYHEAQMEKQSITVKEGQTWEEFQGVLEQELGHLFPQDPS